MWRMLDRNMQKMCYKQQLSTHSQLPSESSSSSKQMLGQVLIVAPAVAQRLLKTHLKQSAVLLKVEIF